MEQFPKIGIVYLSYHSEPYFERALKAIQEMNYPKERIELIVVDNPHPEFGGSVEFIKSVVEANDVTPSSVLAPPSKPLATHGPLMKGEGIVTAVPTYPALPSSLKPPTSVSLAATTSESKKPWSLVVSMSISTIRMVLSKRIVWRNSLRQWKTTAQLARHNH